MPSQRSHSSDLDLETAGSQPQRHQPLSLGRLEVVDPPSDSVSFGRQVIAGCFPFHSRDLRNGAHRPENWWRRFHYALAPKNRLLRLFLNGFLLYLLILGGREFINSFLRTISSLYPDEIQSILEDWGKPGSASETVSRWPTDSLSDVRPVSCHSHNDYWRKVPLYSAIQAGCTSVEADIWLFGQDLYVGHSVPALTIERTLNSLYLGGLLQLLDRQNIKPQLEFSDQQSLAGIFDTSPSQSLTLLVDFKTDGHTAWPLLDSQLAPLRDKGYLTHFDGTNLVHRPLTVVGSGNAPFDLITANETYRDIFYDAPLNELGDESATWENPNRVEEIEESNRNAVAFTDGVPGLRAYEGIEPKAVKSMAGRVDRDTYNASNSYYASVSFTASIGHVWGSRLSQRQLRLIRAQVRGAHERGLKVRYWDVPYWPAGLRNHIWHILIREGVDLISVDDLSSATRRDWRKSRRWLY